MTTATHTPTTEAKSESLGGPGSLPDTLTSPKPSRRSVLATGAALAGLLGGGGIAAKAAITRHPIALGHPDADLIAQCALHIANLDAYCRNGGYLEPEDDPLWAAYAGTHDAISEAQPATIDGILAKARAAKAEALNPDGTEEPEGCPAQRWAWDLVNDLLRLHANGAGA